MIRKYVAFIVFNFLSACGSSGGLVEELVETRRWSQLQIVESKRINIVDPAMKEKSFGFVYGASLDANPIDLSDEDREVLKEGFAKDSGFKGVQNHPWLGKYKEIAVLNFHGKPMFYVTLSAKPDYVIRIKQVFHVSDKLARFSFRVEKGLYLEVKNEQLWKVLDSLSTDKGE